MENLAEKTYTTSNFAWLYDPENEVSDDDLKTARSEIIFV